MGENLDVDGRYSVRTPMQWSAEPNGGFSTVEDPGRLRRPLPDGEYGPEHVNVAAQRHDPHSLMNWLERLFRRRRECPELGFGALEILDAGAPNVLAHRCDWEGSTVVAVHELAGLETTVALPVDDGQALADLIGGGELELPVTLELEPYGARWFRVRRAGRPVAASVGGPGRALGGVGEPLDVGADHLVAAGGLGGVQRLVGAADQRLAGLVAAPRRPAEARRDAELEQAVDVDGHLGDRRAQALADDGRVGRVGQQQQELLVAPARRDVLLAQAGGEAPRDLAQHRVAGGVAVGVVDGLEAVDVDQHGRQRAAMAARAGDRGAQHVVGVAAVGQAGEHVGAGELLELGVAAGGGAVHAARAQRGADP